MQKHFFKTILIGFLFYTSCFTKEVEKKRVVEHHPLRKRKKKSMFYLSLRNKTLIFGAFFGVVIIFFYKKKLAAPVKRKRTNLGSIFPNASYLSRNNNSLKPTLRKHTDQIFSQNLSKEKLNQLHINYSFNPTFFRKKNLNFIPDSYPSKKLKTDQDRIAAYLDYFYGRAKDNDRLNATIIDHYARNKAWNEIKEGHYDWILFPNDRKTANAGWNYSFTPTLLELLLQNKQWEKDYEKAIDQVILAYGFDMKKGEWVEKKRCKIYGVRFMKILYSTILVKNLGCYKKMVGFITALHQDKNLAVKLKKEKDYKWIQLYAQIAPKA